MKCCPTCGQQWPDNIRHGVRLPGKKLRVFDFVASHPGASWRDIFHAVWAQEDKGRASYSTTAATIWQLNELFAATDIRVRGKQYSGYRIIGTNDAAKRSTARR